MQIFEEGSDKASVVLEDYYAEGNVVQLGGVSQSGSMITYSVADGGLTLTPAATAEAATAASVTAGSGFLGSTTSYVLGGLAIIGGGVAVAAGSGSGNGSSTNNGSDINNGNGSGTSSTTVSGTVTAGPLTAGHQLSVKIYQADGTTLLGEATVSETGTFSVNIGTYTGAIIAKVVDAGAGNDFTDETTGVAKDLNATLTAVAVVAGGTVTLNINPVTTIAAIEAGLNADGTGSIASSAAATAANVAVATAFGLADITTTTPITTLDNTYVLADGMSEGEKYGAVLAALSGADKNNGGDMQATIRAVTNGLSGTTFDDSAQSEIIAGANSADANV
ncbi:hypothetical protein, partial [Sulfuricurvum sp.]|uniref:hypothetical protein n=1 Tax=Sulfuricurvum sp. TaxID=2025608 RepID=UPI0019CD88C2